MNPLKIFSTPEYLFRPEQIFIRFKRAFLKPGPGLRTVALPWKCPLQIRPDEVIGANIWYYGIFDLIVAETIARLLDPAETAVDIGANIGQMTSLMSFLTGPRGSVHAFEPHPEIHEELEANTALTRNHGPYGTVHLHRIALSNQPGQGFLATPSDWEGNRGKARVTDPHQPQTPAQTQAQNKAPIQIQLDTLDNIMKLNPGKIGVSKVDVEGHELSVFQGAKSLLQARAIRDIVFEDLDPFPSPVHQRLLDAGYCLFALWSRLTRPVLCPIKVRSDIPTQRDGLNFLATLDSERAMQRFKPAGWRVLKLG